ncbi:MAG TPA: Rieske (2Fe-2S) protein [Candidatus Limnocylindrales bacterium]|nr:Rieske (2Fe-2S) protein [Candidatus Limnocylindrales bacterium]
MDDDPDQLDRYVEDLLQDRKPERTPLDGEDALRARQVAAMLRAARPGASLPSGDFVRRLEQSIEGSVRPKPQDVRSLRAYSRRSLLLGGAGGLAAGVAAALGVERLTRRAPLQDGPVVIDGAWTDVVAVADLPDGVPTRFSSGALEGYLVRTGQEVRGLSAVCTHMGCILNWSKFRTQFECPCHGATFDLNGRPGGDYSQPSVVRPLPALQVRVSKGRVQVYTV